MLVVPSATFRLYAADELGADGYPPVWHELLKHEVRAQAGHRCVRCGHPYRRGEHGRGEWSLCDERCTHDGPVRVGLEPTWALHRVLSAGFTAGDIVRMNEPLRVEAAWRILTVHHLDGDKANCRWWNLMAACQRCHLEIQGKVRMERRWQHEHSAWFKPYVAGYYAHVYLGEDLTRAEAEARMEELLALEVRQGSLDLEPLRRVVTDRPE